MCFVFVDESGNWGMDLSKSGASSHFVVAAVLVPADRLNALTESVESLRLKHFQRGEMKSSRVGGDDKRRMRILQDLLKLDFYAFVGVTDKARLRRGGGFDYHAPFVKYLSKRVHLAIRDVAPALHFFQDEHGNVDFMVGFREYLLNDARRTLFDEVDMEFANSRSFVLLQLADFIAGTVRRQYEQRRGGNGFDFIRELRPKITLHEWPWVNIPDKVDLPSIGKSPFDLPVTQAAVQLAQRYINANAQREDPLVHDRCTFLSYLLCELQFGRPSQFVPTHKVLAHVNALRDKPISNVQLRPQVVAPLRDAGLLIVSSSQGYKLPTSVTDLCEFVNHSMGMVRPMLQRLATCRDQVRLATNGELDLVDRDEYQLLQGLLALLEEVRTDSP